MTACDTRTGANQCTTAAYGAEPIRYWKKRDPESKNVVVTLGPNPEIPGAVYVNADWSDIDVLKHLNIDQAAACMIIAEDFDGYRRESDSEIIDMRTMFTLYKIKLNYPRIHTVAEVINPENTPIVKDLNCDDIIYKEALDSSLITSCILHPNISPIIYELLTVEGKQLKQATVAQMGLEGEEITYRDARRRALERNVTLLGYITPRGDISLAPSNAQSVSPEYRLVYIE